MSSLTAAGLWASQPSLETIDQLGRATAAANLGIHAAAIGPDWLEATLPLDARTAGADGALDTGAMAVLAEMLGSVAASLCIDTERLACVGQALTMHHFGCVRSGPATGRASPIHVGPAHHLWQIRITAGHGELVATAELLVAIIARDADPRASASLRT
ncbi:MAG: hotdog fold thioesterase [Proteobacteria bacterium]|nr:hotdog fold thioesterase [Pseudomonadota bacterium]